MNEASIVQVLALVAWLVLAASAYASYKLEWRTMVRHILIWGAIFAAMTLVFTFLMS